jgi:heterodisulfide reductase subunit D
MNFLFQRASLVVPRGKLGLRFCFRKGSVNLSLIPSYPLNSNLVLGMSMTKDEIVQCLKRIVGVTNVLTEPEDLQVYSFEQFFKTKRYLSLDVVVRTIAEKQIGEVMTLAKEKGIPAIRRSQGNAIFPNSPIKILVDDFVPSPLVPISQNEEKHNRATAIEKELSRVGYDSLLSAAIGLKSFLSTLPAQKCLDCNVCSGYCTVSSFFNEIETWSSKGRAVITQALSSGELQSSPKMVDLLYTCSLCGLCFAQCFETTQVREVIMQARYRLSEEKLAPEVFTATARNISEFGDPAATPLSKRVAWIKYLPRRKAYHKKADVLYWTGCIVSTRTPSVAMALGNLLTKADVDFTLLGEKEGCCGYVLLASGLWSHAKQNAAELVKRVSATGAETLVTPCAGCYYTFSKMYPKMLGLKLPCEILHATQYLEQLIAQNKFALHDLDWKVTYHDPCSLGRHSNVYESPRNVLRSVPKVDLIEMPLNRSRSRCCGAGGGLWSYNNPVATNCATERLVKDAAPLGASALVTACPTCHINFRNVVARESLGFKVYDVVEILEHAVS